MEYPLRSRLITSLYSAFICSSLFSKRLEHLGDALFLLFHVWVNIEIKGCCDVGMTEQYAYGLVVTVAFNAACCKAVARNVVGGASLLLFPVVEGAGFQKGDEALAEILIDFRQGKVRLAYI